MTAGPIEPLTSVRAAPRIRAEVRLLRGSYNGHRANRRFSAERPKVAPHMIRAKAAEPAQPVRGRDLELTALGEHLDQLLSGVGTVVLVEGGAGMGKSRLLAEVAAMARRLSIRVCVGVAAP